MPLFELDDVFTYQDANDIKRLWAADTAPASPASEEVWLDTSGTTNVLKRYNGSSWEIIGEVTAANLLAHILSVDGSGSGIDADKLDGQEGSYYRDADKLDGQEGSFYQNASNLNAGTVPLAQIPATLTGKSADQVDGLEASQFIRKDAATDVNAHTEWQDNQHVRVGSDADGRFWHNGTNTYIDNYTGHLYTRQLSHGNNIYLQAENASGTMKTLLTADPDTERVTAKMDRSSLPDLWRDSDSDDTDYLYIQSGLKNYVSSTVWATIVFDEAFTSTPRVIAVGVKNDTQQSTVWIKGPTTTYFQALAAIDATKCSWIAVGKKT
jgi:hypothetical protein